MTTEKILEVVALYKVKFEKILISPQKTDQDSKSGNREEAMKHCASMLSEIEEFATAGRTEKAFRWLGFVQGVLWSHGIYTIADLKLHNK